MSPPATSRREMLQRSTRAVAGLALASGVATTRVAAETGATGGPGGAARGKRWFKIGACDWSLERGDASSFTVAKEIGLDGVQVSLGSAGNGMHLRRKDVQESYREAARATGLEIASLALGELNNVPLATEPRAAVWLVDSIEVARDLGVKVILLAFFGRGEVRPDDAVNMGRLVDLLKEVVPRAEKAGVVLGLENYLSAADNVKILDRVGSPALQVYYDVGNSTDKSYDILREIRFLGKDRICEFHAKDAQHLFGKGRIDFRKVREAMDDIGYSGWIQIEGAKPNGVVVDYQADLAYLRSIFPREA